MTDRDIGRNVEFQQQQAQQRAHAGQRQSFGARAPGKAMPRQIRDDHLEALRETRR
jgi:hypothetical protein